MPNRVLKESILTSPTIAAIAETTEVHFYRILVLVDDHGCFECTPAVLRGRAYPLRSNIGDAEVARRTACLVEAGMLRTWEDSGRQYGMLVRFDYHSGRAFTDDGKRSRHRRKTPIPPDWARFPKTTSSQSTIYNDNGVGQRGPARASVGQRGPHPDPNPDPEYTSTNMGDRDDSPTGLSSDRSSNAESQGKSQEPRERRRHINPAGETDLLVDYAIEKLNLLDGRPLGYEREDRGTLLTIARHAPRSFVERSMADTQDAHQRARAGQGERVHAAKYFTSRVIDRCGEAGLMSPFEAKHTRESTPAQTESART